MDSACSQTRRTRRRRSVARERRRCRRSLPRDARAWWMSWAAPTPQGSASAASHASGSSELHPFEVSLCSQKKRCALACLQSSREAQARQLGSPEMVRTEVLGGSPWWKHQALSVVPPLTLPGRARDSQADRRPSECPSLLGQTLDITPSKTTMTRLRNNYDMRHFLARIL